MFERAGEGLEKRRMRGQKKKRWKGKRILVLGVVGDDHLPSNDEEGTSLISPHCGTERGED